MTKLSRSFLLSLATGVALATAACGGGSSSATGPEVPEAGNAPQGGATIVGTVLSGGAAALPVGGSSVKGLRVAVTGTSVQTVTDAAGRFTLQGVPTGRVELRFEGSGVDARLTVDGLQSSQTLTVTVHVSGSTASLVVVDDGHGGEVEFEGEVDSVGANGLVVAGRTVHANESTRLVGHEGTPITLSDFEPGDRVEVEGTVQMDGSVLARKIELEDDEDGDEGDGDDDGEHEDEDEVEFTGTISSLSPLTIAGRTVTTDGSTRYLGHDHKTLTPGEVLKVGNKVEVEGVGRPDGSVLAKKIELEEEDED